MTAPIRVDQLCLAKALDCVPARTPCSSTVETNDGRVLERVSAALGTVVSRYAHAGWDDLDQHLYE